MIKVLGMGAMGIFIVGIVGIEDKAVVEVASLDWLLVQGSAERLKSSGKVAPVFCMPAPAIRSEMYFPPLQKAVQSQKTFGGIRSTNVH
jgi:hypothetical protein